ncbi:MAG: sensory box histidine kinase, partial [Verrucomicrobiales bacterium]|nr:sensory box histidine kinase [Verrucomicrobiales bacterium]
MSELKHSGDLKVDYAALWDCCPEKFLVVESAGKIILANSAFRSLFNVTESPGSLFDFASPEDRPILELLLNLSITGWSSEVSLGEKKIACVLKSSPLREESGRVLLHVSELIGPVLEKGQLMVEAELRESEQRLKIVGKATHDVVWDWNLKTNEVWWNENIQVLFGYTSAELNYSFKSLSDRIHPDDESRILNGINKFLEEGGEYWSDEYRMRKKDGEYLLVLDRGFVIHDAANRPVRMIGAMMDITQRKKAEAEIRKLNQNLEKRVKDRTAELEGANRELETFSYSVSHDLRAPLRAIEGFARILREDYEASLDDDGKKYLQVISDNTREMSSLIDDLLSFSRLGREELRVSPVQVASLIHEIVEEIKKSNPGRNLEFRMGDLLDTLGDRTLLKQVFVNLLSNAVKFTSKCDASIIEVDSFLKGENVIFTIKDNGAGFDMKYAHKLFGVFQRLHKVEEYQG